MSVDMDIRGPTGAQPMSETKRLLESAAFEIRDLRRRCELQQAKIDGFELAARFLSATERGSTQGYMEDVAWACEKEAQRLATGVAAAPTEGERP
jgi:hypothetical protein